MAKLSLTPPETFDTTVAIPVPNGTADVRMTFKYRDRAELMACIKRLQTSTDAQTVLEIATGWDLDDEFNAESIKRLCDTYLGAGRAILHVYLQELSGNRKS